MKFILKVCDYLIVSLMNVFAHIYDLIGDIIV